MIEPLISVIVPVYNVDRYLNRCIDSIVNQTYENLEIILVDDGSPDQCPQICDAWAKKDSRIVVIHKENGGLSDARNAGLNIARGEYIAFVDSDDWVSLKYIEYMIQYIIEYDCDIVECEYILTSKKCKEDLNESALISIHEVEDAMKLHLEDKMYKQVVWNKLYKRELINVLFEKGKYHEDVFWTYQIIEKCTKVCHIDIPLYFYFQREDSIIGNKYSIKRLDEIEAFEQRYKFIENYFPKLKYIAQKGLINTYMYHTQLILLNNIENGEDAIKKFTKKFFIIGDEWKSNSSIKFKHKIWMSLYLKFPLSISKIRNFLKIGF